MDRGDVVVVIPVYGARELFEECLRSIVANTPPDTRVVVADDASPDPGIESFTRDLVGTAAVDLSYVRRPENLGFVGNMNAVFAETAPADVVIVNSDTVVPPAWLERLRAAAYSDGLVATASTLSNHGTILTVPDLHDPQPTLPPGLSTTEADARIARASPRIYPRIPTGVGHCLYIRRSALELVGGFDDAFSPGYGEEVDFCQRCLARGLRHVAADDLYVFHHGGGSFGGTRSARQLANEAELNRRYPYYAKAVHEAATSQSIPLARTLAAARLAIGELSVTIDGSSLGATLTGTQVLALELAAALARRPDVRLRVTVPRALGDRAREILDGLGIERIWHDEVDGDIEPSDVVHRPYQVTTPRDLLLMPRLGRRIVLTQLDSIAYHNPAYFADYADWSRLPRARPPGARVRRPRRVLLAPRARRLAGGGPRPRRARGARAARHRPPGRGPGGRAGGARRRRGPPVPALPGHRLPAQEPPVRVQAVRATARAPRLRRPARARGAERRERHLRAGGGRVAGGAPAARDRRGGARRVHRGGEGVAVPQRRARALPDDVRGLRLHPVRGGRGGRPVAVGRPVLDGRPAASEHAGIVPWDVDASAANAARLIEDRGAREALVSAVRAAGADFTWDRTAEQLLTVYREAATAPRRISAEPHESLSDLAMSLVGPRGYLSPDDQLALLAVSARPPLKRAVFSALRGGYRAMYRVRRARGSADGAGS